MDKEKLYKNGINKFKKTYAIFENILIICMILFGFLGMYPLKMLGLPLISIFYVLFSLIMMVFILRKYLCTTCYYYDKCCHCGWGKLSSLMFKKKSGDIESGGKLALFSWSVLMGFPISIMIFIILTNSILLLDELFFFIPFIILVIINGILHKIDCEKCKMRYICPGSSAKK